MLEFVNPVTSILFNQKMEVKKEFASRSNWTKEM